MKVRIKRAEGARSATGARWGVWGGARRIACAFADVPPQLEKRTHRIIGTAHEPREGDLQPDAQRTFGA